MQKKCFLHIGMHKTGSSSIQETLNLIKFKDTHYIKLNGANHSSDIISLFSDNPENNHNYKKRGLKKKEIDSINNEIYKKLIENFNMDFRNFIISGEGIMHLSELELYKFKLFLDEYFYKVIVVGYIRSPWSYMESTFQQQLKGGLKQFNVANLYPNYRLRFEKFDLVFGKNNVKFWKFEPNLFKDNDVVLDFCYRLNIDINKKEVIRTNEALSLEASSLLYIYRKFGVGYGIGGNVIQENQRMIKKLENIGNRKLKFSSKLIQPILDSKKDDLRWIEDRIGNSLFENYIDNKEVINEETDLLNIDENTLKELKTIIGNDNIPLGLTGVNFYEIAILIDILRKNMISQNFIQNNNNDIIISKDNYIFLIGGNHNILNFFTKKNKPSIKSIENFIENINYRYNYSKKRNIEYQHYIFPDKIYFLKNKLDLKISSLYRENYQSKKINGIVNYPLIDLKDENYFFYKTDTHLTHYGNLYMLKTIIKKNLLPFIASLDSSIKIDLNFKGDLSKKMTHPIFENRILLKQDIHSKFFTNGIIGGNNGILDLYSNISALSEKKLLIFGDSYFRSLLPYLSYFYKKIIFCRTPHFHEEIVDSCSPDIVLTGNAERYLSNVISDEDKNNFFLYPLLDNKSTNPSIGFNECFKEFFNMTILKDLK